MSRIRRGEALTAVGVIALFVLLFAHWFSGGGVSRSGWSSVGWGLDVLFVGIVGTALVMLVATVVRAAPAVIVGAIVITGTLSVVTLPIALLRVLLFQPALDLGLRNAAVSVEAAGYFGLAALALTAVGACLALADERTGAPESAYTPPPARPVPGS